MNLECQQSTVLKVSNDNKIIMQEDHDLMSASVASSVALRGSESDSRTSLRGVTRFALVTHFGYESLVVVSFVFHLKEGE